MHRYHSDGFKILNEYYNQNQTQPLNEVSPDNEEAPGDESPWWYDDDSDLAQKIKEMIDSLFGPGRGVPGDGPRFVPNISPPTFPSGGGDFGPIDGQYGGSSRFRPSFRPNG
tara:strand:+ start:823 stop:1158 length:336 start_codon:yes stop_codon:yes gene_type:complete